jgi:lipase
VLPVLLVHGLIGPLLGAEDVGPLSPRRVLAPDLPGYGREASGTGERTLPAYVDHLAAVLRATSEPVHVVGHSVGGVLAVLLAHSYPDAVASLVNVEGNFSLEDAFWTSRLAGMTADESEEYLTSQRNDPERWLENAGAAVTSGRLRAADRALWFQPASTIRSVARSVIEVTSDPGWQGVLHDVSASTPVHLIAGSRSRREWHVPQWALDAATGYTEISDSGHLVGIEQPESFATAIREALLLHEGRT